MHISEQKEQLRQAMKERLERLSEKDRRTESQAICHRLEALTKSMTRICAYYPLVSEPDIRPFLEICLARNQEVYLPVFDGKLLFRRATTLKGLRPGALQIPEPGSENEELSETPDIMIVPGRAFDNDGNRLGRGAGGYDIWLKTHKPKTLVGVCFECQRVDAVPMEAHDERMNAVISARSPVPELS